MRSATVISTLRDVLQHWQGELTSLLLAAATLALVVAALAGWPARTPLGVPAIAIAFAAIVRDANRSGQLAIPGDATHATPARSHHLRRHS